MRNWNILDTINIQTCNDPQTLDNDNGHMINRNKYIYLIGEVICME